MFRPIHLLPIPTHPHLDHITEVKERWEKGVGITYHEKIIELIKRGGGEDFLQVDYQRVGGFGQIMEDQGDLKGIQVSNLSIDFPKTDNFEGINFSYAEFWHSTFNNATFLSTYFGFSKFYNFNFKNCIFLCTNFYGVKFENVRFINCSFIESCSFNNCEFVNCTFDKYFTKENLFIDCLFDVNTYVSDFSKKSLNESREVLDNKNVPNIYKGIKNSYLAGEVFDKYRKYFYKQKEAETRYLKKGFNKIGNYLTENITGYGVRPTTVLASMLFVLLSFFTLYLLNFSPAESIVLSFSAFTTLGDIPDKVPFNYLYIIEAALGIGSFALLITVLANIWFSEK